MNPELQKIRTTSKEFGAQYLMKYDSIKDFLGKASKEKKNDVWTFAIRFFCTILKEMKGRLSFNNGVFNLPQMVCLEEEYDENRWLKSKSPFSKYLVI